MPASGGLTTAHLFIMSHAAGEPSVFLVEREPGVVEFPMLSLPAGDNLDEDAIARQVEAEIGLTVRVTGFVDPPPGALICPPGSRFLLARLIGGSPRVEGPHVGWEWRPAASLLSLHFVPKLMVDELRSYMNG